MNNISIKKYTQDVYSVTDSIIRLDKHAINFVKAKAMKSHRQRARICMHKKPNDVIHEMIIAIGESSYIRPHRHFNKIESFHIIEGEADVLIFDNDGGIIDIVKLGGCFNFYYRLETENYHTIIPKTSMVVIHETTNGPFDLRSSDFALFSPDEDDYTEVIKYMVALKKNLDYHQKET